MGAGGTMSRLEELIAELCPDGVEYKTLGEVVVISRGVRVVKSQLSEDAEGKYPVYQNSMTPLGYFAESNCPSGTTFIISAGAAGEIGYSDSAFWAADDCCYFKCPENLSSRYLYHALQCQQYFIFSRVRKASVPRLARTVIEKLKIPLPPLEVQREIVRILDAYSERVAELTDRLAAELDARKKQYEYYRDDLLTFTENHPFAELCPDEVEYKKLSEITVISRGVRVVKKQLSEEAEGLYPVYQNCMTPLGYFAKSNCPADTTFIISAGAAGEIGYSESAFWAADDCCYFKCPETLSSKYLYYALQCQQHIINSKVRYASVPRLPQPDVEKLKIPLPPLDVQEKIVSILDRFGKLCNDISVGIPAEIEARRKQYEHYRDQLLTFEKKTA